MCRCWGAIGCPTRWVRFTADMTTTNMPESSAPAPAPAGKWTSLPPAEAAWTLSNLLVEHGATITAQSPDGLVGYVKMKKSTTTAESVVLILFFLAFLIPGLIAMSIATRKLKQPFTMMLIADGAGTRMHGNGQGRGLDAVVWAADQLPR